MSDPQTVSSADFHETALVSARNANIGIQTHPIAVLGVLLAALLGQAPLLIAATACAFSLPVALLRWLGARRLHQLECIRRRDWLRLVAIPATLSNAIWGLLVASLMWREGLDTIALLTLLGSIALVFGCTTSFAAFKPLSLMLIGVHLVPPLFVALLHIHNGAAWVLVALLLIAFLAYILRLAISLHRDYWQALRTRNNLAKSRAQAEQASLAKDQFLANISHEIRTPLNGIAAPAELLQHTHLDQDQRNYLDLIASSTRTLMQLIDDVLDFSKMQAGKLRLRPQPFSPRALLEEVIARHRLSAERKGLRLSFSPQLNQTWLLGDTLRIGQIVDNLLSNAVKFTDAGEISVTATLENATLENASLENASLKDATLKDATLVVHIADTGSGIPEALRAQIFQPFMQVNTDNTRRHGGTGLGLSICKQLVEQMEGTLDFSSIVGQGTRFTLTLQLPHSEPGSPDTAENALRKFPGLRVLVAEDNPINQQVAQRQLNQLGIDPELASDGMAALGAAQARPFDLILLDCQMPELDGYQTAAHLRALGGTFADVPIIALTAHAMPDDVKRALDAGMSDYLTKPVSLPVLSRTISKWVDRYTTVD